MSVPYLIVCGIITIIFLYYFGSYIFNLIYDVLHFIISVFVSLCGYAVSIAWDVFLKIADVIFGLYWGLVSDHPIIFISYLAVIIVATRFFAYRLNYLWCLLLVPILSTLTGELIYGRISLNVKISISDAGLLLASTGAVFGVYYAFIRSTPGTGTADGGSVVHKILNHSFVIVLVLMGGAFSIALIDQLAPLLKQRL